MVNGKWQMVDGNWLRPGNENRLPFAIYHLPFAIPAGVDPGAARSYRE
jgi:hypothetical protein